ncbi:GTPase activating protein [Schizosaccharomyces cryophilus OY26]|uniref:GTPase activating protein n=1 Tax=Schizosaccharomyces cryophilus (strain OY26 / ATCC MYA-4695 / CBS 11777 / NBRC 106824 / NRRL Y48691) TaxID=653667 RepID=S9W3S6_SCHCR|nr:GTPase activating protein [Schizosaccharomyces cryophilus OY26]EPY52595.1 GTPase activating protein [Schizosaccharomyces cryophilus OY26]
MDYKERLKRFTTILNSQKPVSLPGLCGLCLQGIPDEYSIRSKAWMLMLEYLPTDKLQWKDVLSSHRKTYTSFVQELLIDPWKKLSLQENSEDAEAEDHPLSTNKDSKWKQYFEDNQTLEQIDKDIRRTLPDLSFFQGKSESAMNFSVSSVAEAQTEDSTSTKGSTAFSMQTGFSIEDIPFQSEEEFFQFLEDSHRSLQERIYHLENESPTSSSIISSKPRKSIEKSIQENEDELGIHREATERILFIYAKLNPGIGYVQGMNELLAPLYYVLATDPSYENRFYCECDSFFLFTKMMVQVRDLYEKTLDHDSGHGIYFLMSKFTDRLKQYDFELWQCMHRKEINPTYYSFRWYTCLFTQEFPLPDVIRLWDSIIADQTRARLLGKNEDGFNGAFDFTIDFCCAILIELREYLLKYNFADSIKLLQSQFSADMPTLLNVTFELESLRKNKRIGSDMSYIPRKSLDTNVLTNSIKNGVLATYNSVKSSSSQTNDKPLGKSLEYPENNTRSLFPRFRNSLDEAPPNPFFKINNNVRTIFAHPKTPENQDSQRGWSSVKAKSNNIFHKVGNIVGDAVRYITEEEEYSEEEDLTDTSRKIEESPRRRVVSRKNVI